MRALEDGLLKHMVSNLKFRIVRYVPILRHAGTYTHTEYQMTNWWTSSKLDTWRLGSSKKRTSLACKKMTYDSKGVDLRRNAFVREKRAT